MATTIVKQKTRNKSSKSKANHVSNNKKSVNNSNNIQQLYDINSLDNSINNQNSKLISQKSLTSDSFILTDTDISNVQNNKKGSASKLSKGKKVKNSKITPHQILRSHSAQNLYTNNISSSLPSLIVQIPAYNEQDNIAKVIKEIPRTIPGIGDIRVLVIDDGSTDNTVQVAKEAGADWVIRNTRNSGLAFSFQKGINFALEHKADILVNTDADFQYNQTEIPKLLQPILEGKADIVSGNRQVSSLNHMVPSKKYGNMLGTKVVQTCAGYKIQDASSGFRAYSREAMRKLFITSPHTYTHESLIQARRKNLKVVEVDVEFRKREGSSSKLISNVRSHIKKSLSTIARTTLMYNSLKAFSYIGILMIIIGLVPLVRWYLLNYIFSIPGGHIQSLILGSLFIMSGGLAILIGLISDMIAINRRYLEEILYHQRKMEFNGG